MTDTDILGLWNAGAREQAFRELVHAYSERLYWHVRGMVGSHEDTDDLLQEIFIKIWTSLPSFRGEARLFTWIWRIATNETLNYLRKQRIRDVLRFQPLDASLNARLDEDPWFDGDAAQRALAKAVGSLPARQRSVFCMRYFEDLAYEDISEVTGTSVGALKASYHFAVRKIKDALAKDGDPGLNL